MNKNPTLGWDLGGAHLKAALVDEQGCALQVFQQPCPLWRGLEYLKKSAAMVLSSLATAPADHAITMTGELADIFADRLQGVERLAQTMQEMLGADKLRFYAGPHGFVPLASVGDHAAAIASANWHASAAFLAAQHTDALFVDIGSTTADLIPLRSGMPAAYGYTDGERLRSEELVYTGVVRTPVMAVADRLPFDGEWQQLTAEHFATMADVYRLTGELPEGYDMAETADGKGKTAEDSARRLARMLGRDLQDGSLDTWRQLAATVRSRQLQRLQEAVERHLSDGPMPEAAPLIGAGAGRFLVRELARRVRRPYCDIEEGIDAVPEAREWADVCLPAYAVARLAQQAGV